MQVWVDGEPAGHGPACFQGGDEVELVGVVVALGEREGVDVAVVVGCVDVGL